MPVINYGRPNNDEMLHIWVEVQHGRGGHGDFLKNFAETYVRADFANKGILDEAARILVAKYKLDEYLDNFGQV